MTTDRVTLKSARATGVLGEYNHRIEFDDGDEFKIVYGPNGVGKTKFLEIIHSIYRLNGKSLKSIPFDRAMLTFSDGTRLIASRHQRASQARKSTRPQSRTNVVFELHDPKSSPTQWTYSGNSFEDWLVESTPWRPYLHAGDAFWEDMLDGEISHISELRAQYRQQVETSERKIPEEFRLLQDRISSHLIEAQRLRTEMIDDDRRRRYTGRPRQRTGPGSKIAQQAAKMKKFINDAQTQHSTLTQQLDRTFPNRVIEDSKAYPDVANIRRRFEEQNAFRSRLGRVVSVALDEAVSLPPRELDRFELKLLNLYLEDTQDKLAPFEQLLQKIELLEAIINERLLKKNLRVTASDGLLVERDSDGQAIELEALSSGEQHEIILMFDLLFNVPNGSTVLIDEPEISLNVVWQMAFIPDVQRIATISGFKFIVATHSPQIINDQWERAIELGPQEAFFA